MLQVLTMRSKFFAAGLAAVTVLGGAEYVRASGDHRDVFADVVVTGSLADPVAAELDPGFVQKLAARMRGPYERSHRASLPTRS